jgi:hypothetical protein
MISFDECEYLVQFINEIIKIKMNLNECKNMGFTKEYIEGKKILDQLNSGLATKLQSAINS